jgi:methionyl-tRNA synthetase
MVGKDILRFHAVYWPAFLMAAGLEPPARVFAHGWWTNEGRKISKSFGNVIDPLALVATYGLDPVRYMLLREVPFGQDGDFSRRAMVARNNGDLANDLGNLAQRVLSMIARNCAGKVPTPGPLAEADRVLLGAAEALLARLRREMEVPAFHRALEAIWAVIGDANRYVDEMAPWTLRKTDPARMGTVLWVLAEALRRIAILLQPVMPETMARLLVQLAVPAGARRFADLEPAAALAAGTPLPAPEGLFPRIVEEAAASDA